MEYWFTPILSESAEASAQFEAVSNIANEVKKRLETSSFRQKLQGLRQASEAARLDGESRSATGRQLSQRVQNLITDELAGLGFESEVGNLWYQDDPWSRADLYRPLPGGSGIVFEIERGGTTTNNHDLKDMWKVHLSPRAHWLFLAVPMKIHGGGVDRVARRLQSFFTHGRTCDVAGVFLYGF